MNCWEFMHCGMEEGGERAKEFGTCPVYPDCGKICAHVIKALKCEAEKSGDKAFDCKKCDFYNSEHFDKSHSGFVFQPMRVNEKSNVFNHMCHPERENMS